MVSCEIKYLILYQVVAQLHSENVRFPGMKKEINPFPLNLLNLQMNLTVILILNCILNMAVQTNISLCNTEQLAFNSPMIKVPFKW